MSHPIYVFLLSLSPLSLHANNLPTYSCTYYCPRALPLPCPVLDTHAINSGESNEPYMPGNIRGPIPVISPVTLLRTRRHWFPIQSTLGEQVAMPSKIPSYSIELNIENWGEGWYETFFFYIKMRISEKDTKKMKELLNTPCVILRWNRSQVMEFAKGNSQALWLSLGA